MGMKILNKAFSGFPLTMYAGADKYTSLIFVSLYSSVFNMTNPPNEKPAIITFSIFRALIISFIHFP